MTLGLHVPDPTLSYLDQYIYKKENSVLNFPSGTYSINFTPINNMVVLLKDIRYYNSYISDKWVKLNGMRPQRVSYPLLVGYYKLDEWGGTVIYNSAMARNNKEYMAPWVERATPSTWKWSHYQSDQYRALLECDFNEFYSYY